MKTVEQHVLELLAIAMREKLVTWAAAAWMCEGQLPAQLRAERLGPCEVVSALKKLLEVTRHQAVCEELIPKWLRAPQHAGRYLRGVPGEPAAFYELCSVININGELRTTCKQGGLLAITLFPRCWWYGPISDPPAEESSASMIESQHVEDLKKS